MTQASKIGWTLAAALGTLWALVGFQSPEEKIARVDLTKLMNESKIGKASLQLTSQMNAERADLLRFMLENRVFTEEQLKKIRVLWFKSDKTSAEKTELEKIKTDVGASAQKSNQLLAKTDLTPEERALLEDYARRSQVTETYGRQYQQEFAREVDQIAESRRAQTLQAVKDQVIQTAKSQGFSMIFEAGAAPYVANDLTASVLQSLNGG